MRTTLDLDARLLKEAMARSKAHTKKETVERGLRELIKSEERNRLLGLKGKGYRMRLDSFLRCRWDE